MGYHKQEPYLKNDFSNTQSENVTSNCSIRLRSYFHNHNGTVRFSLVVDDFAVVWSSKTDMNHFIQTLRQLYTVEVDWNGGKYLGMTIDINRKERHVTLSMPGYITSSFAVFDHKESRARQHRRYTLPQITNRLKPKQPPSTKLPSHPPHNNANYKSLLAHCCTMLAR